MSEPKRKVYEPTETDIKLQMKDYLNIWGIYNYRLMQGIGSLRGVPDRIMHLFGWVVYLEIKKPKGKLSLAQQLFKLRCEIDGVPHWVASSVEELEELIKNTTKLMGAGGEDK